MSQNYFWPPSGGASSNPSVGTNGALAPTSSTEIGGIGPTGNLTPVSVDASGNMNVNVENFAGGALDVNLTKVGGAAITEGQKTMAASLPVVIASDQSAILVNQGTPGVGAWPTLAAQSGTWNINNISGTVSLPTLASTSTLQTTGNTSLASIDTKTPSLGQAVMASSVPVVIASNQSNIPVIQGDLTSSGSITIVNSNPNSGTATAGSTVAIALSGYGSVAIQVTGVYTGALTPQVTVDGSNWIALQTISNVNTNVQTATITSATVGIFQAQVGGFAQFRMSANAAVTGTAVVSLRANQTANQVLIEGPLPAGTNVIGALSANQSINVAQINAVTPLMGNGVTGTGSQRVTIASDNTAFSVNSSEVTSSTATLSNVASSATTVSILASNANRKNAAFFNDSTQILYLKLGTTASLTSYTIQIQPNQYYELPVGKIYTGAIDGIWASANGTLRVTELT